MRDQTTVERDVAGRVTRLIGAVSDITAAMQREAENRALVASQAASTEVLKAISASPDDTQPVFELIARRARELCDAETVGVVEYDGTLMHMRAMERDDRVAADRLRQAFPRPPGQETMSGRTVLAGQVIHARDPSTFSINLGGKSACGVPLLWEGRVIGAIVLSRSEAGGFDDTQIALVQSFAEQAVIAIASATTLRELRQRTAALANATPNTASGSSTSPQRSTS